MGLEDKMSDLRATAQRLLEAIWADDWLVKVAKHNEYGADLLRAAEDLRAALAEFDADPQTAGQTQTESKQGPVAKVEVMTTGGNAGLATRIVEIDDHLRERLRPGQMLYTHPAAQRQPLIADEICDSWEFITGHQIQFGPSSEGRPMYLSADEVIEFARAIEAAHGIGGQDGQK